MSYTMTEARAVATALACEIAEHGAPNSWSPSELHSRHAVPRPLVLGQIGSQCNLYLLEEVQKAHPGVTRLTYAYRRFHVEGVA
jgi:hypothetical protein